MSHCHAQKYARLLFLNLLALILVPIISQAALVTKDNMPEIAIIDEWLNTEGEILSREKLMGKVVLVHFWNQTCGACIREFPYLKRWHNKYAPEGFLVLGVHSHEHEFENDPNSIQSMVKDFFIFYPVAIDANHELLSLFGVFARPTSFLIDSRGRIRKTFTSNTGMRRRELSIQNLLAEKGTPANLEPEEFPILSDPTKPQSEDIHLGYERLTHFGNPIKLLADYTQEFKRPEVLDLGILYLEGLWEMKEDHAVLMEAPGSVWVRFQGNAVNFTAGNSLRVSPKGAVRINGAPLGPDERTDDLSKNLEDSTVTIGPRALYRLTNHGENYDIKEFSVEFDEPGVEVYTLSFSKIREDHEQSLEEEISERIDELVPPEEIEVASKFN